MKICRPHVKRRNVFLNGQNPCCPGSGGKHAMGRGIYAASICVAIGVLHGSNPFCKPVVIR
jgi:hypothetical protein